MINAFQMNTAGIETGFNLTGNAQSGGSQGECLFDILLNNMKSVQETDTTGSLGASLFTQAFLSNMDSSGDSVSLLKNPNPSSEGKSGVLSQASVNSSDLLLPESSIPDLVSFLEDKGFSSEEIDSIVLLSRNDDGLIQINKLVTAIKSAEAGTFSAETGLSVDESLVPKVQEVLFNMGMGVGEVKEVIEESKDESGDISLDKLIDALNEQSQGSMTKIEIVSILEQNNISVTSQENTVTAAAVAPEDNIAIKTQAMGVRPSTVSVPGQSITPDQPMYDIGDAVVGQKKDMGLNRATSTVDLSFSNIQTDTGDDSAVQETDSAALELKREFMGFVDGKTKGAGAPDTQNTAIRSGDRTVVQAQEPEVPSGDRTVLQAEDTETLKRTSDRDNIASGMSRTVTRESVKETGPINQAFSKGQAQWQKGDQGKIIDILKGENQANARSEGRAIAGAQNETMKDPGGFLKQDDQKAGQEIVSGGNENKPVPGGSTNETVDFKDSLLNVRETQSVDLTSQNTTKVSEAMAAKTQTKEVYNLPDPLPKVFDRMVIMIKNGEQSGRLMIQPPELGKIDIDLSIKNGHIQANLTTENITVKEIIEANLNQLKQQLNDQGLVVEQFNVSVGSENRQFMEDFGQEWNNGYGPFGSGESETDEVETAMDGGTTQDIMNSRYRIDVHV